MSRGTRLASSGDNPSGFSWKNHKASLKVKTGSPSSQPAAAIAASICASHAGGRRPGHEILRAHAQFRDVEFDGFSGGLHVRCVPAAAAAATVGEGERRRGNFARFATPAAVEEFLEGRLDELDELVEGGVGVEFDRDSLNLADFEGVLVAFGVGLGGSRQREKADCFDGDGFCGRSRLREQSSVCFLSDGLLFVWRLLVIRRWVFHLGRFSGSGVLRSEVCSDSQILMFTSRARRGSAEKAPCEDRRILENQCAAARSIQRQTKVMLFGSHMSAELETDLSVLSLTSFTAMHTLLE